MDVRVRTLLLQGIEHVLAGRVPAALPEVGEPEVTFVVAALRFASGDFHEALALYEQLALTPQWRTHALTRVVDTAGGLGWDRERFDAARRLREEHRSTRGLDARELVARSKFGDAEGAALIARRLLAEAPEHLALRIELANVLSAAGELASLREELAGLERSDPQPLEAQLERVRLHVEADQCEQAEALAARVHAASPAAPSPAIWLSRFAAWRGEGSAAEAWARKALALAPDSADAWCALGAAQQLAGASGEEAFARAVALDPRHGEANTWAAELALARGDRGRADPLLDVAVLAAGRSFPVAARTLRALSALRDGRNPGDAPYRGGYPTDELDEALEELVPGIGGELAHATFGQAGESLRRALAASFGNRGTQATRVVDGRLRRLTARAGPRLASRVALERIRYEAPELVAARLTALQARYPRSPMPLVHRGELWLWLGRLDEAEADFRGALARVWGTRFAWIGLTGVELLRGRLDEALEVCAEGVGVLRGEGPAVFVYRGETLRRLGRLDEAQADLEAAIALSPQRLTASMNLALVHHARGNAAGADRLFDLLDDCAPALMADARRELGGGTRAQRMERALAMMHGNRSSSTLLYESAGVLRGVPNRAGSAARVHRNDAQDLRVLAAALRTGRPLLSVFASPT